MLISTDSKVIQLYIHVCILFHVPYHHDLSQDNEYSSLCYTVLSGFICVWLFVTLWTVAHEAPLSMRVSRQEYWSVLPCPPPGDLPDPGNLCLLWLPYWQVGSLLLVPPLTLFICSIYASLHLLIANSQSIPVPGALPLATTSLFSVWVCFCFVVMLIYVIF